jgi:outer membrane protein
MTRPTATTGKTSFGARLGLFSDRTTQWLGTAVWRIASLFGLGLIGASGLCQTVATQIEAHAATVSIDAPSPTGAVLDAQAAAQAAADGRMELSLQQAIRMALENNLDIQIEQVDQTVAADGVRRSQGGGTPNQINYSIAEAPAGVGVSAMPLLTTTSKSYPASVDTTGVVASSSYDTGHVLEAQHSLSIAQAPYSAGSGIPAFDAALQGQFGWIRRNPANSIITTAVTPGDTNIANNTLGNFTLSKGFSPGTSVQLGVNDFVQSYYSGRSSAVPFTHPNAIALIAQPLLRGAGRANNTRFIAIAKTNKKISQYLLEQQMISTISGVEALYYDLVSLQDTVAVQQHVLKASQDLLSDDRQQLAVGRMPPIEVARAETLVTANQLALSQAEARRDQQENILRSVVDPHSLSASQGKLSELVATDILSPGMDLPQTPVSDLIQHALEQRPDVRQYKLQITNGVRAVAGSSNARLPEVDLYGSYQTRGVIAPGLIPIAGNPTTGAPLVDPIPAGGQRASNVVEAGIQFNLPLQNNVAEADLGADRAELRQEQLRLTQVEAQAAAEVRNALIGVNAAKLAAQAATASRKLQEQLLSAEMEKFHAALSTNFAVIQQETYLAQAETTEVAEQAAWKKAEVRMHRALGDTLQERGIERPSNAPK